MKKIININLSGRVIPIEDSAYEKLQSYIDSLRRHFAYEEGRDEIINDIESRIAELMNEKVRKGASCVTDADIEEIVSSMGRPEELDTEAEEATTGNASYQESYTNNTGEGKKRSGRLYRDNSDKFLGGVCSGIAAYLNVDPAMVRILFAIITFGGFGLGFLLYILLWIILPSKDLDNYGGKRLFRNPEDRVIGGVAGGMAAYFNKPTWMVRLVFAAPFIFSAFLSIIGGFHWDFVFFPNIFFGSLGTTLAVIYIVLWMILPEARSAYDKMEMRGEKVDVNSIHQNVKDGLGNVKDRVKTWGKEVKTSAQSLGEKARDFAGTRGSEFAKDIKNTTRSAGGGLGHAIGVLFKVFFLIIFGSIAFALFVALLAFLFAGVAWWPVNDFLWTNQWQQVYAWGTILFFLLVPLVAVITWIVRRLLGVRSRNNYMGWVFGGLWVVGWICVSLLATTVGRDFRYREHTETVIPATTRNLNKVTLAVSAPELQYNGRFSWFDDDFEGSGWDLSNDTLRISAIRFDITASKDNEYHMIIKKYSNGRTEAQAITRASNIQFAAFFRDSVFDLGNGYAIGKEDKFRAQHVEIEVQVPVGKKIVFDESVLNKLNPLGSKWLKRSKSVVTVNGREVNRHYNRSYGFRLKSGVEYTMGVDGVLKDEEGVSINSSPVRNANGDYRYPRNDTNSMKETIEQKEKEIKELKEKLKDQQKPVAVVQESMDDKEVFTSSFMSPVFSLIGF